MKSGQQILEMFGVLLTRKTARRYSTLIKFLVIALFVIVIYSVLFHVLMYYLEGEVHSWEVGPYWVLTAMTTTGFGDFVFESTLGYLFSILVMASGIVLLLVALPLVFIQFFYLPWLEAREQAKAPKKLDQNYRDHVIITEMNNVTAALVNRLNSYDIPYVIVCSNIQEASALYDENYYVMVGELDDPETYKNARIEQAALLVADGDDRINSNIVFTVRELNKKLTIVSTADSPDSVDILKLAGSDFVIQTARIIGQSLARRTLGGSARVHVVAHFEELVIGETLAIGTPLVGKTIAETNIRQNTGMNVVGIWERGKFLATKPDYRIENHSVLLLVGTVEQMRNYDELFGIYHAVNAPVLIIGSGRVGQWVAHSMEERQVDYKIIERDPQFTRENDKRYVAGDAADFKTLEKAGIHDAHTVILTTNDDDLNIYLAIYFRHLRPDIQITSRASHERNITTMHRAGADFVISYSTMGANSAFNALRRKQELMLPEGLNIFKQTVSRKLAGKKIRDSGVRETTGCTILAIESEDEKTINPEPDFELQKDQKIVLMGRIDNERLFKDYFC